MKFTITNFGQSRTIMVKGTGYYLTGRGGVLKTNNEEFAEVAATYPGIDVESEKEETKPIKVEKIIEKKPIEVKPLEKVKKIKKTRSKK